MAQHCEDLFALLKFLRDEEHLIHQLLDYKAGKVRSFGVGLATKTDDQVRQLFVFPPPAAVAEGLAGSADPAADLAIVEEGVVRLADLTRIVAAWYLKHEFFHLQYKHGLKLAFRPFGGDPRQDAIDDRKTSVRSPIFALSNERLQASMNRPGGLSALAIPDMGSDVTPYVGQLIQEGGLLRLEMLNNVDLDDLVALSLSISTLLRIAAANRQNAGTADAATGEQQFHLPAEQPGRFLTVTLKTAKPIDLAAI